MSNGGGISAPRTVFEEFQLSYQTELCAGLRFCSTYLPSLEKVPANRFTKTKIQKNCLDEVQGRRHSLSCPGHDASPRASPAISQYPSLRGWCTSLVPRCVKGVVAAWGMSGTERGHMEGQRSGGKGEVAQGPEAETAPPTSPHVAASPRRALKSLRILRLNLVFKVIIILYSSR